MLKNIANRRMLFLCILGGLCFTGCKSLFNTGDSSRNGHFVPPSSAPELVGQLNKHAAPIQTIESDNVDITVTQNGQPFGLNGKMAMQKDRNFRLIASAVASTEADLGSNSQEFWFYMKRNDPPDLFFCSYNDLPQAQMKLPMQPDWIAEALCVQELNPSEYEGRDLKNGKGYELVKSVQYQGENLFKGVIVATSGPNAGRVIMHRMFRSNGTEFWRADIIDYQRPQDVGNFVVPYQVKITCKEQNATIEMKIKNCKVNQLANNPALFARPQGYRAHDIARLQPAGVPGNQITRTSGQ
jgi:hypothetical protein